MKAAVAFLTVLGGPARPDAATMRWFPLVGAGLGLVLGGVWWGAAEIWPPLLAAAVVVAADLALTGLLHVDGLADSADGLLPPLASVERRLEVMRDPTSGAFGVAVVVVVLLLRTAGLASATPDVLVLGALWCGSRTLVAVAALRLPYARPDGLAADFLGTDRAAAAAVVGLGGAVLATVLAVTGEGGPGVAALAAVVLGGGATLALAHRRLGGYTGDVLGATIVVGETVGLVVLGARW